MRYKHNNYLYLFSLHFKLTFPSLQLKPTDVTNKIRISLQLKLTKLKITHYPFKHPRRRLLLK